MRFLRGTLFLLGTLLGTNFASDKLGAEQDVSNERALIMLEIEPLISSKDERSKRSPQEDAGLRFIRQAATLPPEYLSLLQNFGPPQQGGAKQPLIQELALARDGSKQPAAARYVLSHDGRLLQETFGAAALNQQPLQPQFLPQPPPPQPGRPILSPELAAFSREQTRLQQDYHDAPIRAQIAGLTTRPGPAPPGPTPAAGPASPAPQVFAQPSPATATGSPLFRQQVQDPRFQPAPSADPNLAAFYAQLAADPQSLLQQQLQQFPATGNPQLPPNRQLALLYDQSNQQLPGQPQHRFQLFEQQQQQPHQAPPAPHPLRPQLQPTQSTLPKRPLPAFGPSSQPQLLPQNLPPQYLIETTSTPQAHQQPTPQTQFRYVIPNQQPEIPQEPQPTLDVQQAQQQQQFFAPFASQRGLFTPTAIPSANIADKPSRSSIFVSRTASKPVEESQPGKLPLVRLPSNPQQRPLSRQEFDALINAGFSITPVDNGEESYAKAKRQQPLLPQQYATSHVVYQNRQDGIEYQYSPGSSLKSRSKKFAPPELYKNLYRADPVEDNSKRLVTYVLALDTPKH